MASLPVLRSLGASLLVQLPSVLRMPAGSGRPIGPTQPFLQLGGLLVQVDGALVGGEFATPGPSEAVSHLSEPVHRPTRPSGRIRLVRLCSAVDVHRHLNRPRG
jgi:hypothetical protein